VFPWTNRAAPIKQFITFNCNDKPDIENIKNVFKKESANTEKNTAAKTSLLSLISAVSAPALA
jgi:hypothetical protein